MKRDTLSPTHDRILKLVSLCLPDNGLRSGEIEAAAAMSAGEVRMATKWLSDNGFLDARKRIDRVSLGRQNSAEKPLLFWTLTEKGRQRTTELCADVLLDVRSYW
jgi:predicted transcriptional regulator